MSFLAARRNKAAFLRAKQEAGEDGRVCGITNEDGVPVYFVVDKDASDEEISARAFEVRHGRPMNRAEQLLHAAQAGSFVRAYEQAMESYLSGRTDPLAEAFDAVS